MSKGQQKTRDDRTTPIFVRDAISLLNLGPSLHRHTLRSTLWKLIYDFSGHLKKHPSRQNWSRNVAKSVCFTGKWNPQLYEYEHTIPTGHFINFLAPANDEPLPEEDMRNGYVTNLFSKWVTVCWITKDENKLLNFTPANPNDCSSKKGIRRLKDSMPEAWYSANCNKLDDWDRKFQDCWSRYKAVNDYWTNRTPDDLGSLARHFTDATRFKCAAELQLEQEAEQRQRILDLLRNDRIHKI